MKTNLLKNRKTTTACLYFLLSPALQDHFTSIILPLEDIDPFIS